MPFSDEASRALHRLLHQVELLLAQCQACRGPEGRTAFARALLLASPVSADGGQHYSARQNSSKS